MEALQLISRRQALASGLSDKQLRRLCRTGQWHRLRAGHYLNSPGSGLGATGRHLLLALATAETTSDSAITSHCSAAVLHGMSTWNISLDRVHLTRNRINGGRLSNRVVVHSAQVEPDEITLVRGIRVTTPARTVIDIARSEGFEQSVALGDSALRDGLTTTAELREHLRRARHRPGRRKAAQVLDFLDGRSEGVGESRSRIMLHHYGFPASEVQARVFTDSGVCVGRVDLLFPDLGVIGEFDGNAENHNALRLPRCPEQVVIAERTREDQLRALGWMVVRWNWDDLTAPADLLHRLRAAAQIAAQRHRSGYWTPTPMP
ncbi:type IV toxin-antitoxin system AbiEi family antitoxin domain-containing protein [Nocardia sp. NBC_00508]|uniref:type IV toxin-antitoxin system AbiEi family antitoxin domain-containing protein n=1 Tax=Nocardia sp. NBC_00508 TaxID=2975992 RepID=UPI002E7FC1C8|nr:type IV toxin-antitoxin system AbiEi family antitoxin domain-containing protein [Nocardia sp. NBC_00508]WUD63923.1 type IV toxin-antitoxin system AbiEi family antitoxin domain-containing protein [Nocardia sp. NBC_00508]